MPHICQYGNTRRACKKIASKAGRHYEYARLQPWIPEGLRWHNGQIWFSELMLRKVLCNERRRETIGAIEYADVDIGV
jgi:hypothetical protein